MRTVTELIEILMNLNNQPCTVLYVDSVHTSYNMPQEQLDR